MQKNWLKYFLSFAVLIFAGLILFYFFKQSQTTTVPVLQAVPTNAVFIAEMHEAGPVWEKLRHQTTLWPVISRIDEVARFQSRMLWLDTLLAAETEFVNSMKARQLSFSLHPVGEEFAFLFVAEVRKDLAFHQVESLIQQKYNGRVSIAERTQAQNQSALIIDAQNGEQYSFALVNGLFIGSFNRDLLNQALEQLKQEKDLTDHPEFKRLMQTRGTAVDGYVYLQHQFLQELITYYTRDIYKEYTAKVFGKFGAWTALDVLVKKQDLLLNGYSLAADSNDYLYQLQGLQASKNSLVNMLPYSTRLMLHFGFEDYTTYWKRTQKQAEVRAFEKKYNVDVAEQLLAFLSGELAISYIDNDEKPLLIVGLQNETGVEVFLNRLAATAGGRTVRRMENAQMVQMNPTSFPEKLFGEQFSGIKGKYYLITDQYLLIADEVSVLEQTLHMYRTGRTLDMNENFKDFQNNLAEQANLTLYINLRDGLPLLNQFVGKQLAFQLHRNKQNLSEFEGVAFQLSSFNDLIYTSIYLKHNPNYKEESLVAWKTELEDVMVGQPHIVEDHVTSAYNLIVFDASNNMYLISPDGEIRWKKKLSEEPMGEVFVVDYYKNGKYQFLFNTPGYLHLIDRNGNNVSGYPVKLRSLATNGIVVFDYNNRKDYRILVSCADKLTYNYELSGKQVDGWQKPRSLEIVTKNVERLIAGGKDYIIITDIKGNVRIVDRRGQVRISPRGNLEKSVTADFYVNKTNSKGILLTADKQGKLLYVSGNGQLSTTDFGQFSDEHFFLYEDFDQDGYVDFIYLDGQKMEIFNRFKKTLFSYNFKNSIVTKPKFFNITKRKRLLGVVSETSREIYLIDKNGKMIISSGLAGETPFVVGSLHDSDEINLITGIGSTVYNYVIY
ncbi:MAG: hypothetical protein PF694_04085 [Bacteroidetes bacterium]|jgi:hypothetical protein|nr:hypothetical protein [Bacteroidota bacterium]